MSEMHPITRVGDKWRVEFKERSFARDYTSRDTAEIVVDADKDYSEAEKVVGLYSTMDVDKAKRPELADKLRKHIKRLKQVGIGESTIREFELTASILDPTGLSETA